MSPRRSVFERKGAQLAGLGILLIAVLFGIGALHGRSARDAHAHSSGHTKSPARAFDDEDVSDERIENASPGDTGPKSETTKSSEPAALASTLRDAEPAESPSPSATAVQAPATLGASVSRPNARTETRCDATPSSYRENARFIGRISLVDGGSTLARVAKAPPSR
ncbi:MAG: hypothetical protein QM784_33365 [Polyangiaceae bacterium]